MLELIKEEIKTNEMENDESELRQKDFQYIVVSSSFQLNLITFKHIYYWSEESFHAW